MSSDVGNGIVLILGILFSFSEESPSDQMASVLHCVICICMIDYIIPESIYVIRM